MDILKEQKKITTGDWVAIRLHEDESVSLVCFRDDFYSGYRAFYWGQNRQWAILSPNSIIVEIYGQRPKDTWDALEVEFIKKYHPAIESDPKQSNGWISPDGKLFTCKAWGHDGLIGRLSANYYNKILTKAEFEKEGWIMVYEDGTFAVDDWDRVKFTDGQLLLFAKLFLVGNPEWKKHLEDVIKRDASPFA
jgi:hypothetical protein